MCVYSIHPTSQSRNYFLFDSTGPSAGSHQWYGHRTTCLLPTMAHPALANAVLRLDGRPWTVSAAADAADSGEGDMKGGLDEAPGGAAGDEVLVNTLSETPQWRHLRCSVVRLQLDLCSLLICMRCDEWLVSLALLESAPAAAYKKQNHFCIRISTTTDTRPPHPTTLRTAAARAFCGGARRVRRPPVRRAQGRADVCGPRARLRGLCRGALGVRGASGGGAGGGGGGIPAAQMGGRARDCYVIVNRAAMIMRAPEQQPPPAGRRHPGPPELLLCCPPPAPAAQQRQDPPLGRRACAPRLYVVLAAPVP